MKPEEILMCVVEAVKDQSDLDDVDQATLLLGENAVLDSMGLVTVLVDIEGELSDKGHDVTLASEAAMSRKRSPFRSVETLCEYIQELLSTSTT